MALKLTHLQSESSKIKNNTDTFSNENAFDLKEETNITTAKSYKRPWQDPSYSDNQEDQEDQEDQEPEVSLLEKILYRDEVHNENKTNRPVVKLKELNKKNMNQQEALALKSKIQEKAKMILNRLPNSSH